MFSILQLCAPTYFPDTCHSLSRSRLLVVLNRSHMCTDGFRVCRRMQSLLRRQTPLQRRQCRGSQRASQQALELLRLQSQTAKLTQPAATSALSRAKPLIAMLGLLSHCGYLLPDIDSHGLSL